MYLLSLRLLLQTPAAKTTVPLSPDLLNLLTELQGEESTMVSLEGLPQKQLSYEIDQVLASRLKEMLLNRGEGRELARLASVSLPHSGAWLNAIPSPALGLHLRSSEYTVALKLRLGIPVYTSAGPCPACRAPSDKLGDHALCCANEGERIARHNALRDALYSTAAAASLGPTKEVRFLLPGSDRRPADVFLPYWSGGRDTAWDVTVTHPLQAATVVKATSHPGHAAQEAFNRKMREAGELCRGQGIVFTPLALESFGGWHEVAERELRKLGSALARQTGQEEAVAIAHLFQKLSVLLMKGNTALINNRQPGIENCAVDGIQ